MHLFFEPHQNIWAIKEVQLFPFQAHLTTVTSITEKLYRKLQLLCYKSEPKSSNKYGNLEMNV